MPGRLSARKRQRQARENASRSTSSTRTASPQKSSGKSRGIFVVVKTLVGQGSGTVGVTDTGRTMTQYILDAVHEQYYAENGKSISLYPVEMLADRFLNTRDFELYRKELAAFLKDPRFFDEEEQEDLDTFLNGLREGTPAERRDCGNRLWRFYDEHLDMRPNMPDETEAVLENMVKTIVAEGYAGVLLILDEVSLFMKSRTSEQRDDDEKTLVVLSNRIAKHACLPLWTICSAQQAIESKMGEKNIIADDRLKFAGLLRDERNYYDIVLTRVRKITDPDAIDAYFQDYKRGFTWPDAEGPTKFAQYFPFFPPAIDVLRALSYHLTTARSSIHFMHRTLKGQRKAQSNELISLWQMFDDVVSYTEDPSGTTAGIAAISSKFNNEWRAYEVGRKTIGQATKGHLKVYASRCVKILKTLFLYSVAKLDVGGLSVEQIMNCVMEWKDHKAQDTDSTDNLDHYEALCEKLAQELPQVRKAGKNYVFNPIGGGVDVKELFEKARTEAEGNEVKQRQAWEALLDLEKWEIHTSLMRMDLAYETTFHLPRHCAGGRCRVPGRVARPRRQGQGLHARSGRRGEQADDPAADQLGHDRSGLRRLHQQSALRRQGGRDCRTTEGTPRPVLDTRQPDASRTGPPYRLCRLPAVGRRLPQPGHGRGQGRAQLGGRPAEGRHRHDLQDRPRQLRPGPHLRPGTTAT